MQMSQTGHPGEYWVIPNQNCSILFTSGSCIIIMYIHVPARLCMEHLVLCVLPLGLHLCLDSQNYVIFTVHSSQIMIICKIILSIVSNASKSAFFTVTIHSSCDERGSRASAPENVHACRGTSLSGMCDMGVEPCHYLIEPRVPSCAL